MSGESFKKAVIVTNIPNPYRIPLFNELQRQLADHGCELNVLFAAGGYARRMFSLDMAQCNFKYRVLNSRKIVPGKKEKTMFTYSGLLKSISEEKPDKIIVIGFSLATIKLWVRSLFRKTVFLIWSGSINITGREYSRTRSLLRKVLVTRASGFIAYGSKARDYLISLGADPEKIHVAINTVDTGFFSGKTYELRLALKGKEEKKHVTFIGYLEPRKNVFRVLEVVKLLAETRNDFILDLIGDGPEKEKLERFVEDNGISGFVEFHGFRQRDELPFFLARSRCFLFQTDFDIWGLVLNEAMAAGIPCIASIHAGAAHDLIIEGETGFALDFSKTGEAAEKIAWIFDHPEKAGIIGENASRFISENAGLQESARGFVRAIIGS